MHESKTATPRSLKHLVVSGTKWTGAVTVIQSILQFGQLTILSRLLQPDDFGLLAMAMVVIGCAQSISDFGINNAVIQKQEISSDQFSSLYWFSIQIGALSALVVWLSSSFMVSYYSEPRLGRIIKIYAIYFLIIPLGRQFAVMLERSLTFDWLAKVEILSATVESIVAITLAFSGAGALSIVFGSLAGAITKTTFNFSLGLKRWGIRFHFRISDIREFLSFGMFLTMENILNTLINNIDNILIAKFLGAGPLGYYTLAYQLVSVPAMKMGKIIGRVLYPTLSRLQCRKEDFQKAYVKVIRANLTFLFPALAGMALVAKPLILVVCGSKWLPSVTCIEILCITGIVKSPGGQGVLVLLAKGRADISFYWKILWSIALCTSCFVGITVGGTIQAVAYSILVATIICDPGWHYLLIKLGKIDYIDLLKEVRGLFISTLLMVMTMIPIIMCFRTLSPVMMLALCTCVGIMVFGFSYRLLDAHRFNEIYSVIKG